MSILTASPALVKPITQADLAAARMWNIKLPMIPLAPVFEPSESPVGWGSVETADSWPAWTDEEVWELGPEAIEEAPALPADSETASGPTDSWTAELVALNLTSLALGMIEDGETVEALGLYDATEPEFQAAFDSWLLGQDSPAVDWSSWLTLCQTGSAIVTMTSSRFDADGYRPSAAFGFVQTREDEADAVRVLNHARPIARRQAPARLAPFYGDIRDCPENAWHESEIAQARSSFGHPSYEG